MQVFYTSPWLPPELIAAYGLVPHGVWCVSEPSRLPVAAGVCAFAQTQVCMTEAHPDSAFVFSTHCDQLRRGFDTVGLAAPGRTFLFNLPATWQTAVAERMFRSELDRLCRFLAGLGGRPPTAEQLTESLARYSEARRRLLEAAPHCSARQYCKALARFHWDGSLDPDLEPSPPRPDAIPLALVGGPLPGWQLDVLDEIERAGGSVVLNATEAGERSLGPAVGPATAPGSPAQAPAPSPADLLQRLTEACLERCVDVFQRPNTRLFDWLGQRLAARQARGILLWHFVGCDLWRAEASSLREAFGLPVLLLEAAETNADAARRAGRIQAFLESLR